MARWNTEQPVVRNDYPTREQELPCRVQHRTRCQRLIATDFGNEAGTAGGCYDCASRTGKAEYWLSEATTCSYGQCP
ncbi:hypothetical protein DOTSEDRAFT_45333 [Dothistroma septosporum NZE10]|uniref:Uncharacterized protein n=1 Tax=Dothistroma septosporum (strain NZE10 / CBS 128990) TaxID=675120 RepID=M2YN54_DOTSN|nr:hypothetical protein DOTSEDRAFT_45333 [Dothistroma septosporum NZE10]